MLVRVGLHFQVMEAMPCSGASQAIRAPSHCPSLSLECILQPARTHLAEQHLTWHGTKYIYIYAAVMFHRSMEAWTPSCDVFAVPKHSPHVLEDRPTFLHFLTAQVRPLAELSMQALVT